MIKRSTLVILKSDIFNNGNAPKSGKNVKILGNKYYKPLSIILSNPCSNL